MKKILSFLLAAIMILSLSACETPDFLSKLKGGEAAPEPAEPTATVDPYNIVTSTLPEETEAPAPEEEPGAAEAPQPGTVAVNPSNSLDSYKSILSSYADAIKGGWTQAQYTSAGLNSMPALYPKPGAVGYCTYDVNADGTDELLIGRIGTKDVFAVYTLNGDVPNLTVSAGKDSRYFIEPDGIVVNHVKKDNCRGGYLFYTLEGDSLVLNNGLIYDHSVNYSYPWFYVKSDDFNTANASKTANRRAESAVAAYENCAVIPEFIVFE